MNTALLFKTIIISLSLLTLTNNAFAKSCSLSMGWESWIPYQFQNKDGVITGLDIDLIRSILNNMECTLDLKNTSWKRLLTQTQKGEIDLVSGASLTEEREKWAYFTAPYRQERRVLFILKGEKHKYPLSNLNDIITSKFKLGVTRGVYNGDEFTKLMQNPSFTKQLQTVSKESINPKKLMKGRINGYIADAISGSQLLREMGLLEKVEIHPLTIHSSDVYVMFSKKSTSEELVKQFNSSLEKLRKTGKHTQIINQYLQ